MNNVNLMGRLTADPEIRVSADRNTKIARYTLAVNRRYKKEGEADTDFLNCVCFGKGAEFAEKWLTKGQQIAVTGRIQTGSYKNKDGVNIRTFDIIISEQYFAGSKSTEPKNGESGFTEMTEREAAFDDDLPF